MNERQKLIQKQITSQTTQDQLVSLISSGPKVAKVERTATQSISNNTWTVITWDTETSDGPGWFTSGTRMTVTSAGWFLLMASAAFASNSTGSRGVGFIQNGTNHYRGNVGRAVDDNFGRSTLAVPIQAAVGDYFEVEVFQDSGGSLNFAGQSQPVHKPYFALVKIV